MVLILICYGHPLSAQITSKLVEEFAKDADVFYERFILEGPGSVGDNLPLGTRLNWFKLYCLLHVLLLSLF